MNSVTAPHIVNRRSDRERISVGNFYEGDQRYYDENLELTIVKVYSSDCYVTPQPGEMLVTILGSCVAACIRDPIARVGGMNHFLLPGTSSTEVTSVSGDATRYGMFAMEQLINGIMQLGGQKRRFEVKLFGGGNVTSSTSMIGDKNVQFVRRFLKDEGIPITTEHLGGKLPRRIHYYPDSGRVMMRQLKRREDLRIVEEENSYEHRLAAKPVEGDVELF